MWYVCFLNGCDMYYTPLYFVRYVVLSFGCEQVVRVDDYY